MFFRRLLSARSACASYVLGSKTHPQLAVVDPHAELVEDYLALAEPQGAPIVAVLATHLHADHLPGVGELVVRTGARAYPPEGAGVGFEHHPLKDGELAHYSGSVCGRGPSADPASTIGFERRHNRALRLGDEREFVRALVADIPPAPARQAAIVEANRSGRPLAKVK